MLPFHGYGKVARTGRQSLCHNYAVLHLYSDQCSHMLRPLTCSVCTAAPAAVSMCAFPHVEPRGVQTLSKTHSGVYFCSPSGSAMFHSIHTSSWINFIAAVPFLFLWE